MFLISSSFCVPFTDKATTAAKQARLNAVKAKNASLQATVTVSNGDSFTVGYTDNSINNYGLYKWKDGRHYSGEWANCDLHGSGVLVWTDGDTYEGEYLKNKKSGAQGICRFLCLIFSDFGIRLRRSRRVYLQEWCGVHWPVHGRRA